MLKSREELFQLFEKLNREDEELLKQMFQGIPEEVVQGFSVKSLEKNEALLRVGEASDTAYVILEGHADCEDVQFLGAAYKFKEYHAGEIIGDFEILGGIDCYRASIYAADSCTVLVMPAASYLHWLQTDVNALFIRTRTVMRLMTDEAFFERKYLFLSCHDRLLSYLFSSYKEEPGEEYYTVKNTQAETADRVGVNVRTLQRTIRSLEEEDFLTVIRGKMCVSREQYSRISEVMKESLLFMQ